MGSKRTARRVRKGSPGHRDTGRLDTTVKRSFSGQAEQVGESYPPLKQGPKYINGERQS